VARVDTDYTLKYAGYEVGFRKLPLNIRSSGVYTLVDADRGKCVVQTVASNVAVPAGGIFVEGDVLSVSNRSGGNFLLVQNSGVTINWGTGGTVQTGNRTLAVNALVTMLFTASNVCTLTGTGIS